MSISRSIFPIVDDRDRLYFGRSQQELDQIGYIDANTRAVFGRAYAAEPEESSGSSRKTPPSLPPTRF